MPYFQNAITFLIGAVFSFALYIVLLRFWMQWVRADFRNQIGQFVITATNPAVLPLRQVMPSVGIIDTATVVLALLISFCKYCALLLVVGALGEVSFLKLISLAVAGTIEATIYLFMAAIFIGIIASWISPNSYNPVLGVANAIGEPILAPARNLIPPFSGLDFSPMIVLLFLQFSLRLIVAPLYNLPL
jgi:YggT family protein